MSSDGDEMDYDDFEFEDDEGIEDGMCYVCSSSGLCNLLTPRST
jgi:hypothetical protein